MTPKLLIIAGLVLLLCSAMLVADGSRCAAYYPGGVGEWRLGDDGCMWYVHTVEEFDAPVIECVLCHNGEDASAW